MTVVFDILGNPVQPFVFQLYKRLLAQKTVAIKFLAVKVFGANKEVKVISPQVALTFSRFISRLGVFGDRKAFNQKIKYPRLYLDRSNAVHFHNAQFFPKVKELMNGKALIFSFRGYDLLHRKFDDKQWEGELSNIMKVGTRFHFVSSYLLSEAVKRGAAKEKCEVIYRGIDSDFFCPKNSKHPDGPVRIVSTGRLVWQKGYLDALKVISQIVGRKVPISYTIVGHGPEKVKLESFVREYKLEGQISFIDHLDRVGIREILNESDIFFHPAHSEALPNAILEASSMELPIVASNVGGIPEAVLNGVTGFLGHKGDIKFFDQSLSSLCEDVLLRKTMGKNGRAFMKERFNPETEANNWVNLYKRVLRDANN